MKPIQTSGVFIVLPVLIVPFVCIIEKNKKRKMRLNTQRTSGGSGGQQAAARLAGHTLNPKPKPLNPKP